MHTSTLTDPKTDTRHTPPRIPERNVRLIALLDSFDDSDPEQQRQEFDALQAGIDSARPGQRRLFGPGTNPQSVNPESVDL
jgi:hypothetical protein